MDDDLLTIFFQSGSVRKTDADALKRIRDFFRARMDVLLEQSTCRHPLGFFYAVEQVSNGVNLRYHIWPKGWAIPQDQAGGEIHDHIFELNSVILAGSMRHQTYDFLPSGEGRHEILTVTYNREGSQLNRSGQRGELKVISDEVYKPGTVYRVPAGTIHRADASEAPAATLVLAVNNKNQSNPRVVIEYNHSIPANFVREKLEKSDLVAARFVLAQL